MPGAARFVDDHLLRVGEYDFHCEHPVRDVPGRIPVEKTRALVEAYMATCEELRPRRVLEFGVYMGGSTVLIHEIAEPEKLVAIELTAAPPAALEEYIVERGLDAVVRPYYGVDQADRARVAAIVDAEFPDAIDLVIDDASHLYDESVASFETVFPRVRPGGLYVIEDWRWQHQIATRMRAMLSDPRDPSGEALARAIGERLDAAGGAGIAPTVPLSRLVLELVLARAGAGDVVAEVTIGPYWAAVRRGASALDRAMFRVADIVHDAFRLLVASP